MSPLGEDPSLPSEPRGDGQGPRVDAAGTRVALLVNFVAPYRVKLLRELRDRVGRLRIFVSTAMEPDRLWTPDWADLDVTVQRNAMLPWQHRRPGNVAQQLYIHIPYDTMPRLLAFNPDVVISGEMGARSLQAALYRRLRPHSRFILWATLSEHTEKSWGASRRALRRFILRSADAVLVNGQSGARYVRTLAPHIHVQAVNQPVDVSLFSAGSLERRPDQARRLIYSGRLIAQKGVFEFQRALAEWARGNPAQQVEMVWAGDGVDRPALEAAAAPGNLRQVFPGHLDYASLARLYTDSGVLVLPTLWDEWGLVVNEAMLSGLPVLGSIYSQAVEEMVEEGRTGWLFDPLRPDSIVDALQRCHATPDGQLAAMRRAARDRGMSITPASAANCIAAAIRTVTTSARARPSTVPEAANR